MQNSSIVAASHTQDLANKTTQEHKLSLPSQMDHPCQPVVTLRDQLNAESTVAELTAVNSQAGERVFSIIIKYVGNLDHAKPVSTTKSQNLPNSPEKLEEGNFNQILGPDSILQLRFLNREKNQLVDYQTLTDWYGPEG